MKAGWQDASLALRDSVMSNMHRITLFLQGLLTMFTKCCCNLSIDKNVKKLEYVFFPFTMLLCPDLLFNLLKRNTDDSFFLFYLS